MQWQATGRLLPLLLFGALGLSCGDVRDGATDSPANAHTARDTLFLASAKVALPPAGLTLGELPDPRSEGAALTDRYCTECHALPTPQIHSAADWPPVVRRMWLRIEGIRPTYAVPIPSAAERAAILRYLMEHALVVRRIALPDAPGRDRFASICGRCHELPAVDAHSAEGWGPVVERMGRLTESMLGEQLDAEHVSAIAGYLRAAAGANR